MFKFFLSLLGVVLLFVGQAYAQTMGPGLSVIDCPNTTTRHSYHLYRPDTNEHSMSCSRIVPPPPCDCENIDQTNTQLYIRSPARIASRIWADYVGTKSCTFLQTRNAELNKQRFQTILQDENALSWAWPVLLKKYLTLYSYIDGKINQLPAWCEIQKELSSNQTLKLLMLRYLESDDTQVPLSEKIKIYGIYIHLFGENAELKEKLKIALIALLKDTSNSDLSEKQMVIWYGYYHLDFKIGDYSKLARPALGTHHRTALNETSRQALRILNDLKLTNESKDALQWLWLETDDREMMNLNGLINYINMLDPKDELVFTTINDFLSRLENGNSNDYNKVSSLIVISSLKNLSSDQWAEVYIRSYSLADKMQAPVANRTKKRILDSAIDNKVPYSKIATLVDAEIKTPVKSGNHYIDKTVKLYQVSDLSEKAKDSIPNHFIYNHFERMLFGEYGEKAYRKDKDRQEAFDFLKDKNLSAEGARYLLSIYFNTDFFKEVNFKAVELGKTRISYSQARPGEYAVILQMIHNSKLSQEEKTQAERMIAD